MKILIIGERYSSNLGDPIICECVEWLIKKNINAEIAFLDLAARKGYEVKITGKDPIKKARYSSFKKRASVVLTKIGIDSEYLKFKKSNEKKFDHFHEHLMQIDYDLAIFAGGQMFKDSFVFPINTIVGILNDKNIPVIFNACGYGHIASRRMRQVLGKALVQKNVRIISTRDDLESIRLLVGSKSQKIIQSYDPALWAGEVYQLEKKKSDVIGLGVMFSYDVSFRSMLEFWINIIHRLESEKLKWKIFCNGTITDYEFAKYILSKMNYHQASIEDKVIPAPKEPKDLVNLIAEFKGIISFRLHSHIIATALDLPGIAILGDEKLQYFFNNIKMPERVFDLSSDPSRIIEGLHRAVRENYDEKILNEQKSELEILLIENILAEWQENE